MVRAAAVPVPPAEFDAEERALPSVHDTWIRALIVLTLVLQCFAWWRVEGYQIADSVEFMEIAQSIVRGEERVDAGVIRPIGFAFVLLPFFALAEWIGLRDLRAVVWCVTLAEILLGCVLVLLTARVAARIGGRTCAIAAGFLVATNPVFLQYSTQPESGIPAGVCIAFALDRLLVRRGNEGISARRALVGGLWLGAAFLIAYKTILVAAVLVACLVLRDRWKHRRTWAAVGGGILLAVVVQCALDWVMYGAFGASIFNYLAQNMGSVTTSVLLKLHFWIGGGIHDLALDAAAQPRSYWLDRAEDVYLLRSNLTGDVYEQGSEISLRQLKDPLFYVKELPTMLPWPAIALLVVGGIVAAIKRHTAALILVVIFAVNVAAMSNKGEKEFRLWLPLLAIIMPIVALGFAYVTDVLLARSAPARRFATGALLASIGALSLIALTEIHTRRFGGYWVAMEWVNARAAETLPARAEEARRLGRAEPDHVRVAAAYHWAIFRRGSPIVDPVKLPWQLNMWTQYEPDLETGFVREHTEDLSALEDVDVFLVHLPILSEHPELMRWVAANFDVTAAFYDQATYDDLGPIFALERRTSDPRACRFLDERQGIDAAVFQAERQLRGAVDFIDPADSLGERLQLLGLEYRTLPPHGFGWITYHWRAPTKPTRDWTLVDRVTAPYEAYVWDNGHRAAYGALPTDAWEPDTIVSEGYLFIPSSEPYKNGGRFQPIGGDYRRGDLIPVRCWMGVRSYGPDPLGGTQPRVEHELVAAPPGGLVPARPAGATDVYQTADGTQFSADGLVRARGLLLPVLDEARVPDDGRPIRD